LAFTDIATANSSATKHGLLAKLSNVATEVLNGQGAWQTIAAILGFTPGYQNIPQNSQSAAYTAVLGDAGKHVFHPASDANARTFTIPANSSVAFPIGTALTFINMTAEVVSIAITTDTLYLASAGTTGTRSLAQYGEATAIKIGTTEWLINGVGIT
jgi:hypothetical protein